MLLDLDLCVVGPASPRRWIPSWARRPTTWAAVVLLVTALAFVYLGRQEKLREWAPHIAVAAFELAITITIVEWIVRTEARARTRPRVEEVIYRIGLAFRLMVHEVLFDYASTHIMTSKAKPHDALPIIELWLAEQDSEDRAHELSKAEHIPKLLVAARNFVRELDDVRLRNLDVLEPDLITAIDKVKGRIDWAFVNFDLAQRDPERRAAFERQALYWIPRGLRDFAPVLRRYDASWLQIIPGGPAREGLTSPDAPGRGRTGFRSRLRKWL